MMQVVDRVTQFLQSFSAVEAVYIVGSFSRGVTVHDVDILLIENKLDKAMFEKRLTEAFQATAIFVNDDSIGCRIDGIDFDFAFLRVDMLLWRAKAIGQMQLYAEHRNWCVGYWMPEGFLYDLKKAELVFNRSDAVRDCIENLLKNYEAIRQKLMEEIKKEIRLKSKTREGQVYYNAIARSDVLAAVLRLVNLAEGWELTSFKHIDRKIRDTRYGQELEMLVSVTDAQLPSACEDLLAKVLKEKN